MPQEPDSSRKVIGPMPGLLALIGVAAAAVLVPTVQGWEGRELVPYQDIVGIWTDCDGNTKNVDPSHVNTHAECDVKLERQLIAHAKPVLACTPSLKEHPNALAASVSLAYNIGTSAFCRSTVSARFRAGNVVGACAAFLSWRFAGGKEVRGLKRRREAERAICLRDAPKR